MVRVNLVRPVYLNDEHLRAEYVELGMLLTFIDKYPEGHIPDGYRLGKGHMSFFRDKIGFVKFRRNLVMQEIVKRKCDLFADTRSYETEWTPTKEDIELNKSRIVERLRNPLKKKNSWHYYGRPIKNIEYFIKNFYED